MNVLLLHCHSGASGDMLLGALVAAGMDFDALQKGLQALPLRNYTITRREVLRGGIAALKIDVTIDVDEEMENESSPARRFSDIEALLRDATGLSQYVRTHATQVFRRLFEAEAKVHGTPFEQTHLHELSATDAVVDIVGVCLCMEHLQARRVYCPSIELGRGTVQSAHGVLPVPAPATQELLLGKPVTAGGPPFELTTPTGAALLVEFVTHFQDEVPLMRTEGIGYGAGAREIPAHANVLRAVWGEAQEDADLQAGVLVIETNLDDMSPQVSGYVTQRLLEAGALDVWLTPIIMKKGRPGVMLSALCHQDRQRVVEDMILMETTSLGVRVRPCERRVLQRSMRTVRTQYGDIQVKEAVLPDGSIRTAPEYEDCRRAAQQHGVPLMDVMKAARESQAC